MAVLNATETEGLAPRTAEHPAAERLLAGDGADGDPPGAGPGHASSSTRRAIQAEARRRRALAVGVAGAAAGSGGRPRSPGSANVVVIVGARQGTANRRAHSRLPRHPGALGQAARARHHPRDRRGLSVAEADGLLEVAGDIVDIVKLGWGTALVTANLQAASSSATPRTASRSCSAARSPSSRSARAASRA